MINLDMIGRLRNGAVFAGGAGTGSTFHGILDDLNREAKFKIETSDTGDYGSSDHYSFMPKGIPFLFFFTGLHPDYHTPADTWDKIDAPGSARLLDFIGSVAERLLDAPGRPKLVRGTR
jgi:Zn-dependent M28 family amino/carboxypeptidase